MPRKTFEAGMAAGARPFEEKFQKQAEAVIDIGDRINQSLDRLECIMDVVLDDLSAQERKRIYDLNTMVDIAQLDTTEKEYLCSLLYAVANLNTQLTIEQKNYLRAVKSYLKVITVQPDINLSSIENVENITTQKAILQLIMEFLFLEYQDHSYMEDYADIFENFSVNRKSILEIQQGIDAMYKAVGLKGISEHYGTAKSEGSVPMAAIEKTGIDLYSSAEKAFLKYDIAGALSLFRLLEEHGDSRSCYFLGRIHKNGYKGVVIPDVETALCFWEKGMAAGDVLCALRIADESDNPEEKQVIYADFMDAAVDLAQAHDYYAMFEVARIFDSAFEPLHNMDQAIYWYTLASDAGLWCATNNLAALYSNQGDEEKAIQLYKMAANCGSERAMYNLAVSGCIEDDNECEMLLYRAAELGYADALSVLGELAADEKNYEQAKVWYQKAIDRGSIYSYFGLAKAFYYGNYVDLGTLEIDGKPVVILPIHKSFSLLLCAATKGLIPAQIELAAQACYTPLPNFPEIMRRLGYHPSGVLPGGFFLDPNSDFMDDLRMWAKEYLNEQATAGSLTAQYYLGMKYVTAYRESNDRKYKDLAIKWLDTAIMQIDEQVHDNNRINIALGGHILDVLKKLDKRFVIKWPSTKHFVYAD